MDYYIFGAHSRARTLHEYFTLLAPSMHLKAYLYDNTEKNPEGADGVPVLCVADPGCRPILNTDNPVYIGTRGIYHARINEFLKKMGFSDIRPVTVDLDMTLRNAYVKEVFSRSGKPFWKIDDISSGIRSDVGPAAYINTRHDDCLFVVRSYQDKPNAAAEALSDGEKFLQAGTALAPERLRPAVYFDNDGENISHLNRQFCELTGLYWLWKNTRQTVVGLEHYRRRFILPSDWRERFLASGADVILPVPLCVMPSLADNFCSRHDADIWACAMRILKEQHPEDAEAAAAFFKNSLYSPCNMFIMKRTVLGKYCSWLFPMLFAIAEKEGKKEDAYLNRYPGFIAERFLSFWCSQYIGEAKILFADKNFLG